MRVEYPALKFFTFWERENFSNVIFEYNPNKNSVRKILHTLSPEENSFEDLINFFTIQVGNVGQMYGYKHDTNPARLVEFNARLPHLPYIERA